MENEVKDVAVEETAQAETLEGVVEEGGKTYTEDEVSALKKELEASYQESLSKAIEEALAEERRVASLTEEEKKDEKQKKLEEELETLKKEKEDSRLENIAIKELSNAGLDNSFLKIVKDLDEEGIKENVENLKKMFDEAVEKAVTDRLKGDTPKVSNSSKNVGMEEEIDKFLKF